eukprot:CAMPEP_0202958130 /NCGR_PEP_ID=MMETSP1396-20130829/2476_1 /ASSEMBLY_ACC=CAM_ASM_000872 /TAXON_ID= /ORGANISM="Pseudokeronopsis sp., Strain Brazil" /LENGTH=79 /DNA_ID=CAMNT_0049675999 /DNA_START=606 /DNA_END=845 /DNA_ORIENTATION=-
MSENFDGDGFRWNNDSLIRSHNVVVGISGFDFEDNSLAPLVLDGQNCEILPVFGLFVELHCMRRKNLDGFLPLVSVRVR